MTGIPKGRLAGVAEAQTTTFPWGRIAWLFNDELTPGAEMTFGHVVIEPGENNPRHSHDCEEILFVVDGELEHTIGDERCVLRPGDAIRIPAGEAHNAVSTGSVPASMVIAYSKPDRGYYARD